MLKGKKIFVVTTGLLLNFTTTFSSSMPAGAIDSLDSAFNVHDKSQTSLPVALFLVGYIFGPMTFGPISESYGRKPCFLGSFALYSIFTLACAFTTSWPALLFFRFLVGCGASAPQAVLGGVYSDIYPDLVRRGRAVMILGLTSNVGPLLGPVVAGYSSIKQWRHMFWINLGMIGLIWPLLIFVPGECCFFCEANANAPSRKFPTYSHFQARKRKDSVVCSLGSTP